MYMTLKTNSKEQLLALMRKETEMNEEAAKAAFMKTKLYLDHCSVAKKYPLNTLMIPKLFSDNDLKVFEKAVSMTYSISNKVIKAYLEEPHYRRLFPFSKRMERLILADDHYRCDLPIARFDIFYNEDDHSFKFCEINTDGTSAQNENHELYAALKQNDFIDKFRDENWKQFELFDSWIDQLMQIYSTFDHQIDHPAVAIVDYMEKAVWPEFEEFQKHFEAKGMKAQISDVRDLTYDGDHLYGPGGRIDIVYRRAVTRDIEENYEVSKALIQSYLDGNICMIGSFRTQIIHNKFFFIAIHDAKTKALLTAEEQRFVEEHFLENFVLDDKTDRNIVIDEKDKWIIKPLDLYDAQGIYVGSDMTAEKWQEIVDKVWNNGYLCQEYCHPFETENLDFTDENPCFKNYINMTGLYVYGGKLAGIYSRVSPTSIISDRYGGRELASIVIEND